MIKIRVIKKRYRGKSCGSTNMVWYLDSEASDHVTTSSNNIQVTNQATSERTIVITKGNQIPITSTMYSKFSLSSKFILLKDILHVPIVKKNLLLVYKVCKDDNVSFNFNNTVSLSRIMKLGKRWRMAGLRMGSISWILTIKHF